MYCYIGILLLSGYCIVSRRNMYWQNLEDTNNKMVCAAMSRDRFHYIMQNIHCNDNGRLDKDDRYSKMRPLFDILNKKFFELQRKTTVWMKPWCHTLVALAASSLFVENHSLGLQAMGGSYKTWLHQLF